MALALLWLPSVHAGTARSADLARITEPGAFLDQTESLRIKDHPQFMRRLTQIHRESPTLTAAEQWHLRYLDALEDSLEGRFSAAEQPLRDVIAHAGDPLLATKASALLMNNLAVTRRYEDAFTLANQLTLDLPRIHDLTVRSQVLSYLSQVMNLAGQTELAIRYARMLENSIPPGMNACSPQSKLLAALWSAKRLTSASPELQQTIDMCTAAQQPIMVTMTQLVLGTLYLEEHKPTKALSLLDRIAPAIRTNHYYPHTLSAQAQRAQAYEQLGEDENARKAALAALAMAGPQDTNDYLRDAYEVLYRVAKRHGNTALALGYYEHFVTQNSSSLDDAAAQALAYQTVQQQLLTRKMEAEALGKQNNILRLQRTLDARAAETSRLSILLLLLALASIVLWLYRLKRSQMRFKRLSHHDSLTGIFNHQHFIHEADRVLRLLEKKLSPACLVAIDLDHFKQVNDTYGHATGDAVLRRTVTLCQQQLRPTDVFGRLGGEEFGILLHDCSREQGMEVANRIRTAIEAAPMEWLAHRVPVSASVGLTSTDTSGYELQRLCVEADAALYRAKRAGRNRVIADTEEAGLVEA
jgi:diguanylate cyclase (GGDEF)-like protein